MLEVYRHMTDSKTSEYSLGDAPIQEEYRVQMTAIAMAIDEVFNPGQKAPNKTVGFVLLTFPFGSHDGRCNFLSNGADRQDIVTLFKEMIARFEGQPEVKGHG